MQTSEMKPLRKGVHLQGKIKCENIWRRLKITSLQQRVKKWVTLVRTPSKDGPIKAVKAGMVDGKTKNQNINGTARWGNTNEGKKIGKG